MPEVQIGNPKAPKEPHFNFARKSWDQPSPLVGPIKARLAVL